MWRALMSSRFASWVVGMVSIPKARQQQQELDLQRLYILTRLNKAAAQGKAASMPKLLLESQSLEPSSIKREVEAALQVQVLAVGEALHDILRQAGDPAQAATAMSAAHRRLQCRRAREASGLSKLIRGLTAGNRKQTAGKDSSGSSSSITGSSISSSSSSISSSSSSISSSSSMNGSGCSAASDSRSACSGANVMGPMSQEQLAEALQGRIGFRLELGPSSVPHPEAGTGVFIRGEARPGSVVAIFPGVLYGRTQLAHMPNFPKVDTNNPYLSCRYDQSIVDSKPWGPGDPGTSASSGSCAISHLPTSISGIRAADGSSSSSSSSSISFIRDSTASASCWGDSCSTSWWTWAGPLSSALGQLEGRHPLALGHFVNHPGAGQSPNVLEAALDIHVNELLLGPTTSTASPTTRTIYSATASTTTTGPRPWLRAYLPVVQPPLHYDPYGQDAEGDKDEDEEEEDEDEDDADGHNDLVNARTRGGDVRGKQRISNPPAAAAAAAVAAAERADKTAPSTETAVTAVACDSDQNPQPQRQQQWVRRKRLPGELRPEELLSPPGGIVRLLVLVATRALRDGEELLQNYRMNPHVMRPEWYVVHDAEAEQRRWAKVKAVDLGFKLRASGGGREGRGGAAGK